MAGKPLVQYVINCLAPYVDRFIISANNNQKAYRHYTDYVIADDEQFRYKGPLAGIASCLVHCQHEPVLITSCDIPLLPPNLAPDLMSAIADSEVCAAVVQQQIQPVLLARRSCLPSLYDTLSANRLALIDWIKQRSYCVFEFEASAPYFVNVNSPKELAELARLVETQRNEH